MNPEEELKLYKRNLESVSRDYESLKGSIEEWNKERREKREQIEGLNKELAELAITYNHSAEERNTLRLQIYERDEELKKAKEQVAYEQAENYGLSRRMSEINLRPDNAELAIQNEALLTENEDLKVVKGNLERMNQQLREREDNNLVSLTTLRQDIREKKEVIENQSAELRNRAARIKELEQQLASSAGDQRLIEELRGDVKDLSSSLEGYKDANRKLNKEWQEALERENDYAGKLKKLQETFSDHVMPTGRTSDSVNRGSWEKQSLITQLNACRDRIRTFEIGENGHPIVMLDQKTWEKEVDLELQKERGDHYLKQCEALASALEAEKAGRKSDGDLNNARAREAENRVQEQSLAYSKVIKANANMARHRDSLNRKKKKLNRKIRRLFSKANSFSLPEKRYVDLEARLERENDEARRIIDRKENEIINLKAEVLRQQLEVRNLSPLPVRLEPYPPIVELKPCGLNNPFESLLTEEMNRIKTMLLLKNKSYGDSALNPVRIFSKAEAAEGIRVRIDDKLSRLARGSEYPGDNDVDDLLGYLFLYKIAIFKAPK